ncbi:MAG: TetR/AcrR family transcriptional regulator [Bacteroidales bacterium]|nr:TetR/AcrR family transcriptional regulator [Bacteroidales bacterium]
MVKKQILQTALDLFSQYGIKSVSMDDIAKSISVSKRTIYDFFHDKEELLVQGIGFYYDQLLEFLSKIEKENLSAAEIILLLYEEVMKQPRWYNTKYYEDLKRYPKAMQKFETEKAAFSEKFTRLFERGVKEGVFEPGVNFNIITLFAKEQIKMRVPSDVFSNYSIKDIYNTILLTFLKGICTEKGRTMVDRYTLKKTYLQ